MEEPAATTVARLDRMPRWPYKPIVFGLVGTGFFFAYFDINNIGFSLPRALETFHASEGAGALSVSLGLWGYVVGALANSFVSDRIGRRFGLLSATLLYGIGSIVDAVSPTMTVFIAARFISGMGIGAAIGVITTYISEVAPAKHRGRYMSWTTFPAMLGLAVVPFIALRVVPGIEWGWRLLLALPVVATVAFVVGFRHVPESVRWLLTRGRGAEAQEIVDAAETRVRRRVGSLPPIEPQLFAPPKSDWRDWLRLFQRPHLPRTVLFFSIWFLNYLPTYAMGGLGITLLAHHGFSLSESIQLTLGQSVGAVLGALLAPYIADRWSRKYSASVVSILLGAALVALGVHPANILIVIAFFLQPFQVSLFAPFVYLLTAEHFPTQVRNVGVAFCDGVGHLGGVAGPLVALLVLNELGFSAVWIFLGLIFLVLSAVVLLARNTNARSLENVADTTVATA
jgi:putative MFS transporter